MGGRGTSVPFPSLGSHEHGSAEPLGGLEQSNPLPESMMRSANLLLKFGLELAALAALAYWASTLQGVAVSVAVAVAAPLGAAVLWGVFAAPSSSRRLETAARIPFELTV